MNSKMSIALMSLFMFSNPVLSSETATLSIRGKLVKYNTCEVKNTSESYNNKTFNQEVKCKENTALSIKYTDLNENTLREVPVGRYNATIKKEELVRTNSSKNVIVNINVI